ncbi:MAG: hypothetical protein SO125_07635 [Eubacteriales bacterium]|nr:hypothetical protein [Eubacteriales bacterium]MDY4898805.1 hypothetical protein [Eubacteriales bacterium]
MKQLISAIDDLPLIVKIIFSLPVIDVIWSVYRLCRSIDKQNVVGIVLAVLLLFFGPTIVWIIDLICVLLNGKVWWLD